MAARCNPLGLSITGLPGHCVENVTLSNIRIKYKGGVRTNLENVNVPENPEEYPEYHMFGKLPSYGFYCRHVKNLKMHNLDLSLVKQDSRPAMIFDDVKKLDIFSFSGQLSENAPYLIKLKNVQNAMIHGCKPGNDVKTFVKIEGSASKNISIMNNDLYNVEKPVVSSGKFSEDEVFEKFNRIRD